MDKKTQKLLITGAVIVGGIWAFNKFVRPMMAQNGNGNGNGDENSNFVDDYNYYGDCPGNKMRCHSMGNKCVHKSICLGAKKRSGAMMAGRGSASRRASYMRGSGLM